MAADNHTRRDTKRVDTRRGQIEVGCEAGADSDSGSECAIRCDVDVEAQAVMTSTAGIKWHPIPWLPFPPSLRHSAYMFTRADRRERF